MQLLTFDLTLAAFPCCVKNKQQNRRSVTEDEDEDEGPQEERGNQQCFHAGCSSDDLGIRCSISRQLASSDVSAVAVNQGECRAPVENR
ncbi:hypothetical protein AOLI_G00137230 [Acnodon oligacanthus]